MSDFTKLQKDKILNYLYKNFKKIDFDNIDQDISLKKIDDLHFFDKQELLIKISDLLFEDLDKIKFYSAHIIFTLICNNDSIFINT